jgi:hypothetical protein
MAKSIILYNLKEGVTDEEYIKWCHEYKGPFFLSLPACNAFTLVKTLGGVKGNGATGALPEGAASPFTYIGIVDVDNLEEWQKSTDSKAFKEEFFPQWFTRWVADFYVLAGTGVYEGKRSEG